MHPHVLCISAGGGSQEARKELPDPSFSDLTTEDMGEYAPGPSATKDVEEPQETLAANVARAGQPHTKSMQCCHLPSKDFVDAVFSRFIGPISLKAAVLLQGVVVQLGFASFCSCACATANPLW